MAAPWRSLCTTVLKHQCRTFSSTSWVQAGQIWRLRNGLPSNGSQYGPLTDLPDWTYAGKDGRPTPPMKGHLRRRKEREEFARRVVSLSSEVDMGMKQWRERKEAESQAEEQRKSLLLKAKGNHKLKKK